MVLICRLGFLDVNGQTALDGFVKILEQLLESFALGGATGDRRYFRQVAALLRLVDNNFDFRRNSCQDYSPFVGYAPGRLTWSYLVIEPQRPRTPHDQA